MKRKILFTTLILMSSFLLFGAEKTVGLIYNGATGVNQHAFQYIMQNNRALGNYRIQAVDAARNASVEGIDTFILLNSGVSSGTDPVLSGFLDRLPPGAKVIRLNLYRGRPVSDVDVGVDAVTSASVWGNRQARNMHGQWIQALAGFLNQ